MKKLPKKVKRICFHLLIDKWVMYNLEFLTLLLSSEDDSNTKDTLETNGDGDKGPHAGILVTLRRKRKQVHLRLKYAQKGQSMGNGETFSKQLYACFTKIGDDVLDDFTMEALQLLKK